MTNEEKRKLIDAINCKGYKNSLISLWHKIGKATPFRAQRLPQMPNVPEWYKTQFVEVHSVTPEGNSEWYGDASGFYYKDGERADAIELGWCKKDDTEPQDIPFGAAPYWKLLDILGEPTAIPIKVYGPDDILDFGIYKGMTLRKVYKVDYDWIEMVTNVYPGFYIDGAGIKKDKKKLRLLGPDDVLSFGFFRGEKLRDIYENERDYFIWLSYNAPNCSIDLSAFEESEGKSKGKHKT